MSVIAAGVCCLCGKACEDEWFDSALCGTCATVTPCALCNETIPPQKLGDHHRGVRWDDHRVRWDITLNGETVEASWVFETLAAPRGWIAIYPFKDMFGPVPGEHWKTAGHPFATVLFGAVETLKR